MFDGKQKCDSTAESIRSDLGHAPFCNLSVTNVAEKTTRKETAGHGGRRPIQTVHVVEMKAIWGRRRNRKGDRLEELRKPPGHKSTARQEFG